jgi:hypothetical protein
LFIATAAFAPSGSRDDRELHVVARISSDIKAFYSRPLRHAGNYRALFVELTPQAHGKIRPLDLPRREKKRSSSDRFSGTKYDAGEPSFW